MAAYRGDSAASLADTLPVSQRNRARLRGLSGIMMNYAISVVVATLSILLVLFLDFRRKTSIFMHFLPLLKQM